MLSPRKLWARAVGDDVARYFPLAYHRVALVLLFVGALVVQTSLSLAAVRPDELVDRQVLSNESDANSIIAVQRESFNVALALADWGHGAMSARDVQIARALLAQRLNVVTRSDRLTAANVDTGYLEALAGIDPVILGLGRVPEEQRGQVLMDAGPAIERFLTQTRALTEIFQRFARGQVEDLEAANRARQRTQTALQVVIVLLLLATAVSIAVGLGHGYRRVVDDIDEQRRNVERARRDLDVVRDLDQRVAPLLRDIDAGREDAAVRDELRAALDAVATGHSWHVPDGFGGRIAAAAVAADADRTGIEPVDADIVASRAQAVLDALLRRERSARSAQAARRRDPLTGLANRTGYLEDLSQLVEGRTDLPTFVCFLDVDRFSEVNGALGFSGADQVLIELAGRLSSVVSRVPGASLARLGADEFAIAAPVDSEQHAVRLVAELEAAGTYVSDAGGTEAAISWSLGETLAHGGDLDAGELMRQAAVAMLLAKEPGDRRGRVRYDPVQHERLSSTLEEELAVRTALRAGEFLMHYQPIVDLVTGRPCGLEALVRWERPGVGLVPPDEFLPTIERGGFSVEFGFEIISEVLAAWKRSLRAAFARAEGDGGYVSINVDAVQLADAGFEDFILAALARSGIAPEEVVLELTERAAIDQQHAEMLGRLRRAGVRIAVDDFGSGFSSLAQSTRLPVDVLKLDRSFVTSMLASGNDARLFVDMARLASTLGMSLIAEGVETSEVAEVLVRSGIGTGQGFFYSPALAEVDVVRWIASAGGEDGSDLTRVVAAER